MDKQTNYEPHIRWLSNHKMRVFCDFFCRMICFFCNSSFQSIVPNCETVAKKMLTFHDHLSIQLLYHSIYICRQTHCLLYTLGSNSLHNSNDGNSYNPCFFYIDKLSISSRHKRIVNNSHNYGVGVSVDVTALELGGNKNPPVADGTNNALGCASGALCGRVKVVSAAGGGGGTISSKPTMPI